jgi:ribosomal protein L24E
LVLQLKDREDSALGKICFVDIEKCDCCIVQRSNPERTVWTFRQTVA